jgi:dihydroneopterin aldolase
MALIALEGMQFYAYHGFYKEERIIGNHYLVDVSVEVPIGKAAETDALQDTLNYETIYLIVEKEMQKPSHLLEHVVENIIKALKFQFASIEKVEVKLKKLNPPLDGLVAASSVAESLDFRIKCSRCNKNMVCYNDNNCWCAQEPKVSVSTLEKIKSQFGNQCLCKECLGFYL